MHALRQTRERFLTPEVIENAVAHTATVVEDYPDDPRGPSTLFLVRLPDGAAVHVLLGFRDEPPTVITAYRPSPEEWGETLTKRKGR